MYAKGIMKKNLEEIQCTLLCHPLKDVFIDLSPEEIQYNLQQNGLFQAHEEVAVDELEKEHVWEIAQKEFERLKKSNGMAQMSLSIFSR